MYLLGGRCLGDADQSTSHTFCAAVIPQGLLKRAKAINMDLSYPLTEEFTIQLTFLA